MASLKVGENKEINTDLIQKACSLAVKAHSKSSQKSYIREKTGGSSYVIFSFPGYWSKNDWYDGESFGETKINTDLFPPLKSIGIDEHAQVNKAFQKRFVDKISTDQDFINKVEKAKNEKKQIVFTGHSIGGSVATLATIWFLENYWRSDASAASPLCLTFGCPLIGNHIFSHALRREKWAPYFIHFVMRYDIVPRIFLAPFSSIKQEFQPILEFLNPKSSHASTNTPPEALNFYTNVMKNASSVASHAACKLMGNTNLLLETMTNFTALSPYKPFGTFVFCTGKKLVILSNPDAVLQLLFYSSQLDNEAECPDIAQRSLQQHFSYGNELKDCFNNLDAVFLESLEKLPLSADSTTIGSDITTINAALKDLGLSTRARLCLCAAGELEKRKIGNKNSIDLKKADIAMKSLQEYQLSCRHQGLGCYDAFKIHKSDKDFEANVKRLELAGIWDEIIEMLKNYDLPDAFEGEKEWIDLGTKYRRLVEPIDIANYYRHLKNNDTEGYMIKGRPKRYKFTQRWLEHAQRLLAGSHGESCFWADVEELRIKTSSKEGFAPFKDKVLQLEEQAKKWINDEVLDKDVLMENSTFMVWWKKQPELHKLASCINDIEGFKISSV